MQNLLVIAPLNCDAVKYLIKDSNSNNYKLDYCSLLGTDCPTKINKDWIDKYLGLDINSRWNIASDEQQQLHITIEGITNTATFTKSFSNVFLTNSIKIYSIQPV